jgi:site-specific DNA-methyltransferase (adenine-specific)
MPDPTWQSADGRVQLYLGDCLAILPTLPAGSVDAVVTDPPYGHNNNNGDLIQRREEALGRGKAGAARAIANDGAEANDVFRASLPLWRQLMPPGACCCCCCCGGGPDPQFARWSLWLDDVFDFKQMVVWDKGPMGLGWHYRRSYEVVLVGQVPGAACRWFDTSGAVENVIRPNGLIRKIIPSADQHPTEKPVELAAHFIRLHTTPDHTVMDPFMGSGTTGVAAVRLGRKFLGVEIDPGYFEIARKRIEAELRQGVLPLTEPEPVEQSRLFPEVTHA